MGPKTKARTSIARWWKKHDKHKRPIVGRIRHVHARAVVVGYAAPKCLVVRIDGRESERHMREWDLKHPLEIVYEFDHSLREGDRCWFGYVSTADSGESVAVKACA